MNLISLDDADGKAAKRYAAKKRAISPISYGGKKIETNHAKSDEIDIIVLDGVNEGNDDAKEKIEEESDQEIDADVASEDEIEVENDPIINNDESDASKEGNVQTINPMVNNHASDADTEDINNIIEETVDVNIYSKQFA